MQNKYGTPSDFESERMLSEQIKDQIKKNSHFEFYNSQSFLTVLKIVTGMQRILFLSSTIIY